MFQCSIKSSKSILCLSLYYWVTDNVETSCEGLSYKCEIETFLCFNKIFKIHFVFSVSVNHYLVTDKCRNI